MENDSQLTKRFLVLSERAARLEANVEDMKLRIESLEKALVQLIDQFHAHEHGASGNVVVRVR